MDENLKFDKKYWDVSKFSNGWNSYNIKKLNMDEIGPIGETWCNKGKLYYTKTTILKW